MKTRSGGRSDEIHPGDAPRSVRQRRSRLKMPRFVVGASIEQEFEAVSSLKDSLKDEKKRAEYEVEKRKQLPFSGCVPEGPVSEKSLEMIRFHLVEFVTSYEKVKGREATPVTRPLE